MAEKEVVSKLLGSRKKPKAPAKRREPGPLKRKLMTVDFFHFLLSHPGNLKEYRRMRIRNAANAVENLVMGLGGDKNLVSVKNTVYSLQITFKSDYLLEREFLAKSGGVDMRIVDRTFFTIFDKLEAKLIARRIKQIIKGASRKYKVMDVEVDVSGGGN